MATVKVLQILGSLGMGGAESRMMDVYRNLDKTSYTFDFLTMQEGVQHYEPELLESGARVIHVKNPREVGVSRHIKELRKVMREGGYDAVHAHTSYHCGLATYAAKKEKIPVRIAHARTTGSKQRSKKAKLSAWLGRRLIKKYATARLAISNDAGKFLFKKSAFTVIPNAICLSKYINVNTEEIKDLKQELGLKDEHFVIGQIGRFDNLKNHAFTVKWFSEYIKCHQDARLVFVGDGALRNQIEEDVNKLELQDYVIFTGIREDVNKLIHTFNVLIFPSLFEGLGGVVLEAQASGVPTVESENIPKEADLDLDMVFKCSLLDDFSVWSKAIDDCRGFISPEKEKIIKAFNAKGYSIQAVVNAYCEIYKGNNK